MISFSLSFDFIHFNIKLFRCHYCNLLQQKIELETGVKIRNQIFKKSKQSFISSFDCDICVDCVMFHHEVLKIRATALCALDELHIEFSKEICFVLILPYIKNRI